MPPFPQAAAELVDREPLPARSDERTSARDVEGSSHDVQLDAAGGSSHGMEGVAAQRRAGLHL
jgi:hypothetical protein